MLVDKTIYPFFFFAEFAQVKNFFSQGGKRTSLFLSTNRTSVISLENQQFQTVIVKFLFNLSTRDLWI